MLTHYLETKFIPTNRELKTVQIIFQIRTYQLASFLNYAKYRVIFSINWLQQIELHFISNLPELTSTVSPKLTSRVFSRTLFVEIKTLYQPIETYFRLKSKKLKKISVLCQNLRKFLNKTDKSAIEDLVSNQSM